MDPAPNACLEEHHGEEAAVCSEHKNDKAGKLLKFWMFKVQSLRISSSKTGPATTEGRLVTGVTLCKTTILSLIFSLFLSHNQASSL